MVGPKHAARSGAARLPPAARAGCARPDTPAAVPVLIDPPGAGFEVAAVHADGAYAEEASGCHGERHHWPSSREPSTHEALLLRAKRHSARGGVEASDDPPENLQRPLRNSAIGTGTAAAAL